MSSKAKELEQIDAAIRQTKQSLSIFQRDVVDPSRVNKLIADKRQHIAKLEAEVKELQDQQSKLPALINQLDAKLRHLQKKRTMVSVSPEIKKLEAMIAQAKAAGVDVAALLKTDD